MVWLQYFYDVSYRLEWKEEVKEIIWLKESEIDLMMKQLKNMSLSLDWELISWINELDHFQVIKRDYREKDWDNYIQEILVIDENWEEIDVWDNVKEVKTEDITNKLLFDYWITWKDYYKMWKVLFEDWKIYVNSHHIEFNEWSWVFEFFQLVLLARDLYKKNNLTYNELKFVYKECWINFKTLQTTDLSQLSLNDLVWKKLKTIKDRLEMEENCIKISINEVCIRQETAPNNMTSSI